MGGADIDNLGGLLCCPPYSFGGGIPKEEIRKSMDDLDKDIKLVPLGGVSVDDFAKLVAHYAVEEFINRLK
jgi:hypothetical protein